MWNKWVLLGVSVPVIIAGIIAFVFFLPKAHPGLRALEIGNQTVYVYVADNVEKRELGLGGRNSLAADEGMLFIFPNEGKFPFWMKDMKFAIDILWIANDGTVIHIEKNVTPETYPKTFAPESGLARYVLELPAGYTAEHQIEEGDKTYI